MITSGISFKNFKIQKKSLKIKKKLEKFIAENNSIAQSLKRNYQDFFKKKELKKYKSFKNSFAFFYSFSRHKKKFTIIIRSSSLSFSSFLFSHEFSLHKCFHYLFVHVHYHSHHVFIITLNDFSSL